MDKVIKKIKNEKLPELKVCWKTWNQLKKRFDYYLFLKNYLVHIPMNEIYNW